MHGPVASPFRIFAGAVERVDDPHARSFEAPPVVEAFLREHRIGRPPFGQAREDEGVGDLVRDMAEPRPGEQAAPPLLDQQAARFLSQMRRQIFVGQKAAPSGSVVGRVKQG